MNVIFTPRAWHEYTGWQLEDKKTLRRINQLIKDIERNGNSGIGKPEPLKGWLQCKTRRRPPISWKKRRQVTFIIMPSAECRRDYVIASSDFAIQFSVGNAMERATRLEQ